LQILFAITSRGASFFEAAEHINRADLVLFDQPQAP
jgi:hypothetical protein